MFVKMTRKLSVLASNRRKLLLLGVCFTVTGILIAASFQFIQDHRWYWNAAPFICLLVLISAAFGGLMVGHGLSKGQHRRLWLAVLGGILAFAWLGTGMFAAGLSALGMYGVPTDAGSIGWNSYTSGYMLRSFDISFLQLATVTGFLGGFAIGLGLAAKRFWLSTPGPVLIRRGALD